jgi:hypothetical protein
LYIGREEEAGRVVSQICRINGLDSPNLKMLKYGDGEGMNEEESLWAVRAYPGMRRNLIILALTWFRYGKTILRGRVLDKFSKKNIKLRLRKITNSIY